MKLYIYKYSFMYTNRYTYACRKQKVFFAPLCDVPKWSITKDLNEKIHPCDTIYLLKSRFKVQCALFNLLKL